MTVPKPTLTPYVPGHGPGDKPTDTEWNTNILQQGAWTQLMLGGVAAFPASPALADSCYRSDLGCWFRCSNATGPVWSQMSVPSFTTAARPAAPPTNYVYFDTTLSAFEEYNGATYASVSSGGGGGTSSAFGAYNSSTQTFTASTAAQVLFPTAAYNVGGNYTAASSLYTAPASGQYLLTGTIEFLNSTSTNFIIIYVTVNGTATVYPTALSVAANANGTSLPFTTFLNLTSGDVVKIFANASVTVSTQSGATNTVWNMAQVGAGPQGATGAAGITWQGAYAGGTTYALHDGVTNGGESFLSLGAGNVGNTPTAGTGDAHWLILAQKGGTGSTGAAGITWQGAWLVGTTYVLHDGVTNGGESFLSLGAGNVGNTPTAGTGDAHWLILAQKGTTGAAGAGLVWRGAWSSVTAYSINDAVYSGGSAWVALTAGTNQALPAAGASNTNWSALTQAGAAGTWAHGTSFPGSPALNDPYFRDDLRAQFQCTNATGPVWTQVSYGAFTNSTKPAAATYTNLRIFVTDLVQVQESDGTNWHVLSGIEYEILGGCTGKPATGQIVCHFKTNQPWTLPANMAGSQGDVGTNGTTGSATVQLKKNGTNITNGTLVWPAATAAPTLGTNAATAFAQGDILTAVCTPDSGATLADMTFTISGVR